MAVRPNSGMARSMDNRIRSIKARTAVERVGRLAGFELIDIRAAPKTMARAKARIREASSVNQAVPVYHTSDDGVPFVPVGTIYLSFKPDQSNDAKQEILVKYGLEIVASEPNEFLTVRVTGRGTDAVEVAARLQKETGVAVAEPDLATTKRLANFELPNDELLAQQWHLENTGILDGQSVGLKRGADARVVAAWKTLGSLGSSDVVVGIIDDGFDLGHPDLSGKSVFPWDFERNSSDVHPEPDRTDPDRGNWHGTACAGVAVGSAQAGQILGVAPGAKLLPVRWNDLTSEQVAKWFNYMTERGAGVVSCSWGAEANFYELDTRITHAIERCARDGRNSKGCVIVFAAGNSGTDVNDPPRSLNGFATHSEVMAVAASTSIDTQADYSNFGDEIWVCAPSQGLGGRFVITSDATGTYIDDAGVERSSGYTAGDYASFTGTSSSCALLAGVCALVLSANPELTSAEVREIIKLTARRIGPESEYRNGHSTKFGYGCVDADSAVKEAIRRLAPVA